jgi:broad specificity phosphatase PhoE
VTLLCLVRHGQTDWNLDGRYQGQSDVPLNEAGVAQAKSLAEALRGRPFAALHCSNLKRAMKTSSILSAVLDLPISPDRRLREINQGVWEGQVVETIRARYSELWLQRDADPLDFRAPGGETVSEVADRVRAALDDISVKHPGALVLVVSHGLARATALCIARSLPLGRAYDRIPACAEPVWIAWGP